jgi:hypothetical protein
VDRKFLESDLKNVEPNSEASKFTRQVIDNLAQELEPNLQKLARFALLIG